MASIDLPTTTGGRAPAPPPDPKVLPENSHGPRAPKQNRARKQRKAFLPKNIEPGMKA